MALIVHVCDRLLRGCSAEQVPAGRAAGTEPSGAHRAAQETLFHLPAELTQLGGFRISDRASGASRCAT